MFDFLNCYPLFSTLEWYIGDQKLNLLNASELHKNFVYCLSINENVDEKRINDLVKLSDKYHIDLIKGIYNESEINYFLYGKFPRIANFLYNNENPDFLNKNKYISYSSVDHSMYILDREKDYNVYSMNYLVEKGTIKGKIFLTSDDEINLYQFCEEFKTQFPNEYIDSVRVNLESKK